MFFFLADLEKDKEWWAKDLEDMKTTLHSSENKLSTVSALADSRVADANRALDLARQLRRDADRDVFQAVASIRELEGRLDASTTRFRVLWNSLKYVMSFISEDGDEGLNAAQFAPLIPSRFYNFLRNSYRDVISGLLSHFWVLAPEADLDVIAAEPTEEYSRKLASVEPRPSKLVDKLVDQVELGDAPSVSAAGNP